MRVVENFKGLKKRFRYHREMISDYIYDYQNYLKFNYNGKNSTSYASMEAKIYRSAHHLEKGMSLSMPKDAFGIEKAKELFSFLKEYLSRDYDPEGEAISNARAVLAGYLKYQQDNGHELKELWDEYRSVFGSDFTEQSQPFGIEKKKKDTIISCSGLAQGYYEFKKSRHSVRQFSKEHVDEETILKAVSIAKQAPSACNRQSVKVYYYKDKDLNLRIGKFIGGNRGFEDEVQNYLVITSSVSSFGNANERNQMYVDAGLFTMSLIEALHFLGIASCILQNGEHKSRDKIIRGICTNIPDYERIVLFIAIGHYKENVVYAASHRKSTEHVLEIL